MFGLRFTKKRLQISKQKIGILKTKRLNVLVTDLDTAKKALARVKSRNKQ